MTRRSWLFSLLALGALGSGACAQQPSTSAPRAGTATVDVLDVGQGDAILIRSPEGKTALVDAGPSQHVAALLRQHGIGALDLLVLSHHHADHYGGMAEVVREFHPRVFLDSGSPHTSEHYLRLLRLIRDRGTTTIGPAAVPRKIELGSVVLTIFPQPPSDTKEENNNSVGLRLQYGGFSMLLPGDAENAERQWWERAAPELCTSATVLKLAHHGSRNGTDARWLSLIRPRLAIASEGLDNEFGHPHPETIALLAQARVPLLRTDRDGTVSIRTDGRTWQVYSHPHVVTGDPLASSSAGPDHRALPHARAASPSRSIDLNTATELQLRTIPGIGPVLARRIVEGRPYRSVDELRRVSGIGKKRLEEIRPYVLAR